MNQLIDSFCHCLLILDYRQDIEAQNEANETTENATINETKPPEYFADLPPTYEEAMKLKAQEQNSTVISY